MQGSPARERCGADPGGRWDAFFRFHGDERKREPLRRHGDSQPSHRRDKPKGQHAKRGDEHEQQ